jgi:mitochondrial inner membrane protease ATP23
MSEDCSFIVESLIASDPKIKILLSDQRTSSVHISCRSCVDDGVEGNARATLMDYPLQIVLCSNRLASKKSIREALVHELVHAYDYANGRYDMLSCAGLAASEIRAAREAECERMSTSALVPSFIRDQCVKYYATRSTENLFPNNSSRCIADAFSESMQDRNPFKG